MIPKINLKLAGACSIMRNPLLTDQDCYVFVLKSAQIAHLEVQTASKYAYKALQQVQFFLPNLLLRVNRRPCTLI
jgi:hypothetical protein